MGGLPQAILAVVLLCVLGAWRLADAVVSMPDANMNVRKSLWRPSSGSTHILKIGTPITLSPGLRYTTLGNAMYRAWILYFDWLNRERGGIKVNGMNYSVELVLVDDGSDKNTVEWATEYLINHEHVDIFLGPYSSGLTGRMAGLVQAAGKVAVAPASSGTSVFQPNSNIFGMLTPNTLFLVGALQAVGAADGGSRKTVMYVAEDVSWTKSTCAQVPRLAGLNNMQLLGSQILVEANADQSTMGPAVSTLMQQRPDVVVSCVYRTACHSLLKEMERNRYTPKALILTICVTEDDFLDRVESAGQYAIGVSPWMPRAALTGPIAPGWTGQSFSEAFDERFGSLPPYQAASAFAAAATLVHAMEQSGSIDPANVAAYLRTMSASSMYGQIAFDGNGQCTGDMLVLQHQPLGLQAVFPARVASAGIVYPKPDWESLQCFNTRRGTQSRFGFLGGACVSCPSGRMSSVGPPDSGATLDLPVWRCVDVTGKDCTTLANGTVSCAICQAGYFCPSGTGIPCTLGKYCPAGSVAPSVCPQGSVTSGQQNTSANDCEPCQPGSHSGFTGGTVTEPEAKCIPCSPGAFAASNGSSSCQLCAAGKVTARHGQDACEQCPSGYYMGEFGMTECSPCNRGEFSAAPGASECNRCPQGKFTDVTNATRCTDCPVAGTSTRGVGARGPSECVCGAGTYLSLSSGTCTDCPLKMQCPLGSSEASLRSVAAGSGPTVDSTGASVPYPLVDQAFWTSLDNPLSVYRCTGSLHCPGGDPGSCAPKLSGLACARCEDGFFWTGQECFRCSGFDGSELVFPLLPVFLCFALVCFLYYTSRDPLPRWGSWKNSLMALGFITLTHFQILFLINTASVQKASIMGDTWKFWALTIDVLSIFHVECNGIGGFTARFVLSSLAPLGLLLITLLAYLSSQLFAKVARRPYIAMEFDCIWNVFFSLIFTFFIGIANMSLSLFKCRDSPNGKATNARDPSIICYEGEWNSLVVAAVFSVLLYCVACGALFAKAIFSASRGEQFSRVSFQKRWKFLFIKFRPDVPWWAIVLLVRGVVENTGFVFLAQGLSQVYWVMFTEALYMCSTAYCMPWRVRSANWLSIATSVSILFACTLISVYADRDANTDLSVGRMAVALSFGPLLLAGALAVYVVVGTWCLKRDDTTGANRLMEVVTALVEMGGETCAELYHRTGEWDRYYMRKFCDVIQSEFLAMPVGRRVSCKATTRAAIRRGATRKLEAANMRAQEEEEECSQGATEKEDDDMVTI